MTAYVAWERSIARVATARIMRRHAVRQWWRSAPRKARIHV
jgi:hypothetical protein